MNSKIKKVMKNPLLLFETLGHRGFFNWMSDEKYLKILYRVRMKKKLNLDNPQTFNEKLQWLKLNNKDELLPKLVDKYEVKEYISKIIGKEYIIPTLGVYDKFDDIDFDKLPNQFVIKCTHDSGGIVICNDKSSFNIKKARKKISSCLKHNYYYGQREWPYRNVKPRIIIEKFMSDGKSNELIDYKLMCFNGNVKYIFTCTDRYSEGLKVTFFDTNWHKMPFERHYPASKKDIEKPKNLKLMIELAEKLSKDIPFVRVDFYEVKKQIYFGELTFYPGSGCEEFKPEEWDYKLGKLIDLSKVG